MRQVSCAVRVQCPLSVDLLWSTELGSSVYSTPLVYPMFRDGSRQLVFTTFTHFVEIVDHDGTKPAGWPVAFEGSTFHTSPTLHDINHDGIEDILVVDR